MKTDAKILILDDDAVYLAILRAQLEVEGYQVYCTSNPELLETMLDSIYPDLVLLDELMPGCTGTELVTRLKSNSTWSHLPLFIMSATSTGNREDEALDHGAEDFIDRFMEPSELLARIRRSLTSSKSTQVVSPLAILSGEDQNLFRGRYKFDSGFRDENIRGVYKAQDVLEDRWVSVKFLNPKSVPDGKSLHRLAASAEECWTSTSGATLQVHDYSLEPAPHIVTTYIPGHDLQELLEQFGQLATRFTVDIGIQAAKTLDAMHTAGICHNNLKTGNIRVDAEKRVYLLDCGAAASSGGGNLFVSPERYNSNYGKVDHRADIYALGMALYLVYAGRHPFGDSARSIEGSLRENLKPPSLFRPDKQTVLDEIILRALSRFPDGRYQRGNELAEALGVAMQNFDSEH